MAFRHLYYFPIQFNLQTLQTETVFFSHRTTKIDNAISQLSENSDFIKSIPRKYQLTEESSVFRAINNNLI